MKIPLPNIPGSLLHTLGLYATAALLAYGWYAANNHHQQEIGAMREQVKGIVAQRDRLEHATHDTDTLYQRDTVVLKRVVQRYDTVTAERQIHDTVWVTKALDTADSVKRACIRVLADCNVAIAQRDTLIDGYKKQLAAQMKLGSPSKVGLALKLGAAVGVGYLLGRH